MKNKKIALALATSATLLAGCVTHVKMPTSENNPPPAEAFSKFTAFELRRINTSESCNKQRGGDQALRIIQERLHTHLGSVIAHWNSAGAQSGKTRKLIIEPVCSDAKLVGTGARMTGGWWHGSSAVVMKVRYIDETSGNVIAEPVFYQRANAMGATYSFGATDRDMLQRIVDLMTDYATNNYQVAVGGPTGL